MPSIFRIRELRRSKGFTQVQLANKLGLKSSNIITMWESGLRKPSSAILPDLAQVFGCSIDELYSKDLNLTASAQEQDTT